MTDNRDFDRAVARLLDDGSDATPPEVINAVLLAVSSTPQERDIRLPWRTAPVTMYLRIAAAVGIVSVIGLAAFYALGAGTHLGTGPTPSQTVLTSPRPSLAAVPPRLGPDPVSAERMAVVRQQVEAINARDADVFIDAFIPEAVFAPGGDFGGSSSLFGNSLPLADASLVEAWMAINRAWNFEAEILACNQDPEARIYYGTGAGHGDPMVVNCEVAARWKSLSTEITERWIYEFHGTGLGGWRSEFLDFNPRERELPLGYDGLEAWEAWLVATDPASAARYLNPRTTAGDCDACRKWVESLAPGDPERAARLAPLVRSAENAWSIQGHSFWPYGLIPYDPAFAVEIEASIREYLEEVQS